MICCILFLPPQRPYIEHNHPFLDRARYYQYTSSHTSDRRNKDLTVLVVAGEQEDEDSPAREDLLGRDKNQRPHAGRTSDVFRGVREGWKWCPSDDRPRAADWTSELSLFPPSLSISIYLYLFLL